MLVQNGYKIKEHLYNRHMYKYSLDYSDIFRGFVLIEQGTLTEHIISREQAAKFMNRSDTCINTNAKRQFN